MTFSGKTVLVAGASSGIGRETALMFAAEGARVIAVARSEGRLADLQAEAGETLRTIAGDLTDSAFTDRLVAEAGAVDILVNLA